VCDSRSGRGFLVAFDHSHALIQGMSENAHERTERADGVLLLTMIEAARVLSIGRTTMYELAAAGEIEVVHIGRSARVPVGALEEYVDRQRRGATTVRSRTSAARAKLELDPGQPTT
jgi:excisionase family DNA binding protein